MMTFKKIKIQSMKFRGSGSGFRCYLPPAARHLSLLILLCSLLLFSCRRYSTQQPADTPEIERLKKEVLLRVNRELVEEDAVKIKAFAERSGWKMQPTESGLWYMIYSTGQGEKAVEGKVAALAYTVSLLDGTVCYSSEQLGAKVFRLGQGGVETGLEEGVLLMRVGDKARFIMPPHLAHGLTGDGDCIRQRAIILYDVELISLK
jgi:FKBP-type peptidyl-prolyl cis-trans isomerase